MSKKFVDRVASSTICDFLCYISSRKISITVGCTHDPSSLVNLMNEFFKNRAVDTSNLDPNFWDSLHREHRNAILKKNKSKNKNKRK